jgi:hypothetical protein
MNPMFRIKSALVFSCLAVTLSGSPATAQEKLGSQFIPFDAIASILISPAAITDSPATQLYPHEIAEAWCLDNIGFAPKDCESIKFVTAMPGPAGAMAAAIIKMKIDFAITDLNPQVIGNGEMIDVEGRKCIEVPGAPGVVIHQFDSKTAIMATQDWLDNVINVADGNPNGALAQLADKAPHAGHLTALVAIEPVRPVVNGFLQSIINQIPPPFVEFTEIPNLLDAVLIRVNLDDQDAGLDLTMLATDEDAAQELLTIVDNGMKFARQMALMQVAAGIDGNDPVQAAAQAYFDRMADQTIEKLTPKREGRRLSLSASPGGGIATQGMLVGLLLPAVQSARFAARRASSNNNLKMIGLALHNHHSAFKSLPDAAIRDEDGKPLLSWRVKILPFIEEQGLYEQFHLDEPWDSPHNIKLLEQMPAVYEQPNLKLPPGKTVYQAPVGDELMFKTDEATGFRQVTDGLSNTVMVFESSADNAVEWTKPDDVEIDLDDPLTVMGDIGERFSVLLGDGAVRSIPRTIDADTLKKLLTRSGGEVVPNF